MKNQINQKFYTEKDFFDSLIREIKKFYKVSIWRNDYFVSIKIDNGKTKKTFTFYKIPHKKTQIAFPRLRLNLYFPRKSYYIRELELILKHIHKVMGIWKDYIEIKKKLYEWFKFNKIYVSEVLINSDGVITIRMGTEIKYNLITKEVNVYGKLNDYHKISLILEKLNEFIKEESNER